MRMQGRRKDYDKVIPTHFICNVCKTDFLMVATKREFHSCKKCGQLYELVPTRYGVAMVLVEGNVRKVF